MREIGCGEREKDGHRQTGLTSSGVVTLIVWIRVKSAASRVTHYPIVMLFLLPPWYSQPFFQCVKASSLYLCISIFSLNCLGTYTRVHRLIMICITGFHCKHYCHPSAEDSGLSTASYHSSYTWCFTTSCHPLLHAGRRHDALSSSLSV